MRIQILILGFKGLRYRKTGNKNYAPCLAILLQNVLNSDVALFATHIARGESRENARAPRGFATRSRVRARLASLAQIGEPARTLPPTLNLSCNKSGCYQV